MCYSARCSALTKQMAHSLKKICFQKQGGLSWISPDGSIPCYRNWESRGRKGLAFRRQICLSLSNNLCKVLRFESCIRLPGRLVKSRLLPHPEAQIRWGQCGAEAALVTRSPVKMLLLGHALRNLALEAPGGEVGHLPSCAWRGIWEAADLVLPLLFLLPWLARDG